MKYLKFAKIFFPSLVLYFGLNVVVAQDQVTEFGYRIVNTYPHDINAFTQGLIYHDGYLFEGTGKRGLSSLSKINLEDSTVLMSRNLNRRYFGEGIEVVDDRIYQLTWQSHMVFVWDKNNFEPVSTHYNSTEGWGLAFDGTDLILSDGTSTLYFLDTELFVQKKQITVTLRGSPLANLNELEYINGEIWANIWQTDFIARIDPETGMVVSLVDLTGLSAETNLGSREAVLNGIAWDDESERLFVTGKHWAHLFQIELVQQ